MAILEVTLTAAIIGQRHENVLHFSKGTWDPLTDPAAMNTHLQNNWLAIMKQFAPNELTWSQIRIKNLSDLAEPSHSFSIQIQGTSSSISGMPTFVCFLFKLQTATAGRSGRGRIYQSSPNPGHVVADMFTASMLSFYAPKISSLNNAYTAGAGGTYTIGVCKRGHPETFKPCTSIQLDTIPRVQRRRNLGVGA